MYYQLQSRETATLNHPIHFFLLLRIDLDVSSVMSYQCFLVFLELAATFASRGAFFVGVGFVADGSEVDGSGFLGSKNKNKQIHYHPLI